MADEKSKSSEINLETDSTRLLARVEAENPIVVHTGSYADKDQPDGVWIRLDLNRPVKARTVTKKAS